MRRREFLGLGAAGVMGALWRPREADVAVDVPWTTLDYGTDLRWAADNWGTLGTVGNGTAYLRYRRLGDILFYRFRLLIGSTTVLPSGSYWWFEIPPDTIIPTIGTGTSGLGCLYAQRSASPYVVVGASIANASPGGYGIPALTGSVMGAVNDNYALNLNHAQPWAWAAGDFLHMTGFVEQIDN